MSPEMKTHIKYTKGTTPATKKRPVEYAWNVCYRIK